LVRAISVKDTLHVTFELELKFYYEIQFISKEVYYRKSPIVVVYVRSCHI